ncbi:MAG: ComEC/Rec2 family competence protein [Chitinophagaceae bacterium]
MSQQVIPFWKKAPFFRLLVPLITGIIVEWYIPLPLILTYCVLASSFVLILLHSLLKQKNRYRFRFFPALPVFLLLVAAGILLLHFHDIRNHPRWRETQHQPGDGIVLKLQSQPTEKPNSFKCIATAFVLRDSATGTQKLWSTEGLLYLYFPKDSLVRTFRPGTRLFTRRSPEPVLSSRNPHAFDYQRYSLYQGTTHQLYLRQQDYAVLTNKPSSGISTFLPSLQRGVLGTIKKYIPGDKEAGLAEALLIGYKEDLDPDLVSDYSNTGIAHIIAISGMHLALIYWLLMFLMRPLEKIKGLRYLAPLLTVAGLWTFTLLAGAQPSVLRSAVMFTCIVTGRTISRNHSIYNSLSASAFILLCFNPFWLWDLGFQLSYAAVLSLLVFMMPVYRSVYFRNKLVDMTWKSISVSLSAQILTLPMSIFYFHQFPNYFILSNLVAVPLSTIILFAEIILCAFAGIPAVATITGALISRLINLLNLIIDHIAGLPFATMNDLQIDLLQVFILYLLTVSIFFWLSRLSSRSLIYSLILFALFITLRSVSFITAGHQYHLIVYNVPKKSALEYIRGRHYTYIGDTLKPADFNFHLRPNHIYHRTGSGPAPPPDNIHWFYGGEKKIIYLHQRIPVDRRHATVPLIPDSIRPGSDPSFPNSTHPASRLSVGTKTRPAANSQIPDSNRFVTDPLFPGNSKSATHLPVPVNTRPVADLLILNRRTAPGITDLNRVFVIKKIIFDSSVPVYMAKKAAGICDSLGISFHIVAADGAFIMQLR